MYTIEARQAKSNRHLDSPAESLLGGFDPFNFPIIARHWFGWSPAFQLDNMLADLRFRRDGFADRKPLERPPANRKSCELATFAREQADLIGQVGA